MFSYDRDLEPRPTEFLHGRISRRVNIVEHCTRIGKGEKKSKKLIITVDICRGLFFFFFSSYLRSGRSVRRVKLRISRL